MSQSKKQRGDINPAQGSRKLAFLPFNRGTGSKISYLLQSFIFFYTLYLCIKKFYMILNSTVMSAKKKQQLIGVFTRVKQIENFTGKGK